MPATRTPHWMRARFPGRCYRCRRPFAKGAAIFVWPQNKIAFCNKSACGGAESATVKEAIERAEGQGKLFEEEADYEARHR